MRAVRAGRKHRASPGKAARAGVLDEQSEYEEQYDRNKLVLHEVHSMFPVMRCQGLFALNSAPTVYCDVRKPVVPANSTFLNPASSISFIWSRTGTVPPIHCDHASAPFDKPAGSSFSNTTSANWSFPPGFRTRWISRKTVFLQGERLITPFEITTSKEQSS